MTTHHTRRRVIAAMGAIPVATLALPAAAAQIGAAPDPTRFNRRLATYRRHLAEQEAFFEAVNKPLNRAHEEEAARHVPGEELSPAARATFNRCLEGERGFDARCSRTFNSAGVLLSTPAPDYAAVITKLQVMTDQQLWECGYDATAWGAVMLADMRRLGGEA